MMDVPSGFFGICGGFVCRTVLNNACGRLNKRSTKVEAGS